MKKLFLICAIALLATELSYGQFALGLKLGYTGNSLTTNIDSVKASFSHGFHVGAWSRIGKRLYLAPEVQYSFSSSEISQSGSLNDWKQKVKIGSLDIPVLLGFKIIHSDFITWRLEAGPEASFVVNKSVEDENSITGPIENADIKTAKWYILAGTGIDILFLKLDIRYQYGLSQLVTDVKDYSFDTKSNGVVISLGFKILGKK